MTIIITICVLILIAYLFDLSSSRTRIPSVILLLLLGWILRQLTYHFSIPVPDLAPALPILGTVGLILIVLEGSLELELNKSKSKLVLKTFLLGLLPLMIVAAGIAYALQQYGYMDMKLNLLNALPLCVISSAIAIPSVRHLSKANREFVTYESSFSDIIGVLLFNFIALNEVFGPATFGRFGLEILIIIVLSFLATIGLAFLLNRIEHHIKFVPIILLTVLIYMISKIYHLPGLIFILIFGLFLGNLDELKFIKWINKLKPDELNREVHKFKDLTIEGAFLIRSLFFLLFGFQIETSDLLQADTLLWALGITLAIFVLRAVSLAVSRVALFPLLFIAPRGLITILLFLSIDPADVNPLINKSLIIQVVVLTALIMMLGLMYVKKEKSILISNTIADQTHSGDVPAAPKDTPENDTSVHS